MPARYLITLLTLLSLSLAGCQDTQNQEGKDSSTELKPEPPAEKGPEFREIPSMAAILDTLDLVGSILIYDQDSNLYKGTNIEWAHRGFLPASTFKIPNSIIALETGVVESRETMFKWDGQPRRIKTWEQDLSFADAFKFSCLPCYREIARAVGPENYEKYLEEFGYGDMVLTDSTGDLFWVVGESKISQVGQIEFLRKFYNKELAISDHTHEEVTAMMVLSEGDEYRMSGKTGWAIPPESTDIGWFVGYLEKEGKVYYVATNVTPGPGFDMELFFKARQEVSMQGFRHLGIIH